MFSVRDIPLRTFNYIIGTITVVGGGGTFLVNKYEENLIYKSKIVVEAIDIAKSHKDLMKILGEPVYGEKIDAKNKKNLVKEETAHIEIPLKGTKHKAMMLIDASKNKENWTLDKVNISFPDRETVGIINLYKRQS